VTPVAPIPPAVAGAEVDNRVGSETSGREQGHVEQIQQARTV
jgi:hypothetical protein